MNIFYDDKQSILWNQLVTIAVALAMVAAAAYAVYSSNRSYPPLSSSRVNSQRGNNHMDAGMPGDSRPAFDSDSSGQLQQGTSIEQGSSTSPQNAGTSNPTDPAYCDGRFMECASPAY